MQLIRLEILKINYLSFFRISSSACKFPYWETYIQQSIIANICFTKHIYSSMYFEVYE
jgi:hypothetical protein